MADILSLRLNEVNQDPSKCEITADCGTATATVEIETPTSDLRPALALLQDAILRSAPSRKTTGPPIKRQPGATPSVGWPPSTLPSAATRLRGAITSGADQKMIKEIGTTLFEFLFKRDKILDIYRNFMNRKQTGQPAHIQLEVNHRSLGHLPWETLYDLEKGVFVSAIGDPAFTRVISQLANTPVAAKHPLRILGTAANVKTLEGIPLDSIEGDAEQRLITEAVTELQTKGRVKLGWTASATVRELERRLYNADEKVPWDIWHFIGHGGFDIDAQGKRKGFIVVEQRGSTEGMKLYADTLLLTLRSGLGLPKLVILNSCSGAQSQPGELFSSTALYLVENGIPAVIAMQFEVSDEMAKKFSDAFYTHLSDGRPIASALAATRIELMAEQWSEWISPVLYMSTSDGPLVPPDGGES